MIDRTRPERGPGIKPSSNIVGNLEIWTPDFLSRKHPPKFLWELKVPAYFTPSSFSIFSAFPRSASISFTIPPFRLAAAIYKIIKEITVPTTTTHRISTFKMKAANAAPERRIRGMFQGMSKAKRIVTVRRRPTKEHNMPVMIFLK
jgi:hypothetical protein